MNLDDVESVTVAVLDLADALEEARRDDRVPGCWKWLVDAWEARHVQDAIVRCAPLRQVYYLRILSRLVEIVELPPLRPAKLPSVGKPPPNPKYGVRLGRAAEVQMKVLKE